MAHRSPSATEKTPGRHADDGHAGRAPLSAPADHACPDIDPLDRFRLTGKNVLVVGIGPAIGQAVARAFAAAGAHVTVNARNARNVADLVETIAASGGEANGIPGDINDETARAAVLDAAGPVDILFYNAYAIDAGMVPAFDLASPLDASAADWEACFRTNLLVPFLLAKALVPGMIARGGGNVIHCVAAAAFTPILPAMAYGATKAGLATMTQYLAKACAPSVRVNAIAPSNIVAPGRPGNLVRQAAQFPMGRLGLPEEVATTALYLASDAASFVTGQVIHVDGGRVNTA